MKTANKKLDKFMKDNGITNILEYVQSLRNYEAYVEENYPGIHDEAWANEMNQEEEREEEEHEEE